jgi:Arc/MetJ family transcription regulator
MIAFLCIMRTTIDVPERLLKAAAEAAGTRTRNEAVRMALDEYVRRHRVRKLLALQGKVAIDDLTGAMEEAELAADRRRH